MGYRTPNLDRIAREGAMFTDSYGQQSCTAGRAAFITGQSPIRTGLTKVGMPGAALGLSFEDPSVGEVMKHFGYATGPARAKAASFNVDAVVEKIHERRGEGPGSSMNEMRSRQALHWVTCVARGQDC